jgi:sugar lactone lactonase YvrE
MRRRGSLILTRLLFALVLVAVFGSPAYCGILVYVTNAGAAAPGNTAEYTGAGAFVQNFVASPSFTGPDAIALDASGNVFVADAGSSRIVKFAPNGTQLGILDTSGSTGNPTGLTFDAAGNLYASIFNASGGNILEFAGGAGSASVIATGVPRARGVMYDPYNNLLYITSSQSGTIYTLPTTGGPTTTFYSNLGSGNLRGLVFSGNNLYVADGNFDVNNGAIYEFIGSSTTTGAPIATGLQGPNQLAADAAGRIYAAEYYGNDVLRMDANGGSQTALITGLSNPTGLAVSDDAAPEPTTFALLSLGALLLVGAKRKWQH